MVQNAAQAVVGVGGDRGRRRQRHVTPASGSWGRWEQRGEAVANVLVMRALECDVQLIFNALGRAACAHAQVAWHMGQRGKACRVHCEVQPGAQAKTKQPSALLSRDVRGNVGRTVLDHPGDR